MSELSAVLRRSARRAITDGQLDEAEHVVQQLRQHDPLAVETRALELELLIRRQRHAEAEALASQLLERFTDSARVHYLAGRLAYLRKDYSRAEQLLAESDRLDSHPWTRRLLGKTLTQAGRFEESEAVLLELVAKEPLCLKDLAWLHERRGDLAQAAQCIQRYLAARPDDDDARAHLRRVRAASMEPGDLMAEVDGLLDLGEPVPENLWPPYCDAALRAGRRDLVETVVARRLCELGRSTATGIAWTCYRMQAHDLAFNAFRAVFESNVDNPKFLTAFEAAARRAGRLDDLQTCYRAHTPNHPRLHGRLKRLAARRSGS